MSNYWIDRALQLEQSNFKSNEKFVEFLHEQYDSVLSDLDKEVFNFLVKISEDNNTSLSEAKRLLNSKKLKGFKMGLKKFTENSKTAEYLSDEVLKELNNASHTYRISKLQAVELELKAQIDRLLNYEQRETFKHLKNQYEDNYYNMIYDTQKISGFTHIQKIPEAKLDILLNKPWASDEKNFSTRIWGRRDKLINEMHKELTQSLIRGDSPDKIIKRMVDKFDTSKKNAKRLVMTESSFITSQAQHQMFLDMGVKKYEIVSTLDFRTSDICQEMDGRVFNEKDRQESINAPPFHPHCRTVTVPYFDDDIQRELESTRMARDPVTGKSKRVENLKYKDWREKYVVSNPEALTKEKAFKNIYTDKEQHARYKEIVGKDIPRNFADFQDLKYNNIEAWRDLKVDYRKLNAYNKIILNEPQITRDLQDIANKTNTELVGLDFRLKSKESYLRKVDLDSNKSKSIATIDDTINNMGDVIRYTYQSTPSNLTKSYFSIRNEVESKEYKFVKVKNSWLDEHNPYKGVNCNLITKDGQKFEVQFHTRESFELKNGKLHSLYEKWRVLENKASKEAIELNKEMFKLSKGLEVPKDIEEIR